jgi:hypothetical protein
MAFVSRAARVGTVSRPNDRKTTTIPTGMGVVGFLGILTGAWVVFAPFVGPIFGWDPAGSASWAWTRSHWLLSLLPGVAAAATGIWLVWRSTGHRSSHRAGFGLAGIVLLTCASWLVLGPAAWPTFESSPISSPATALDSFVNVLGAYLGPGLLLAILAGMTLKAVLPDRPATVVAPAVPDEPGNDHTAASAPEPTSQARPDEARPDEARTDEARTDGPRRGEPEPATVADLREPHSTQVS